MNTNYLMKKKNLIYFINCYWIKNLLSIVIQLSGSGFKSSCSHFTFRFRACFKQGVPWHWGNYRVWIHSHTRTWHDKNIQMKLTACMSTTWSAVLCWFIFFLFMQNFEYFSPLVNISSNMFWNFFSIICIF